MQRRTVLPLMLMAFLVVSVTSASAQDVAGVRATLPPRATILLDTVVSGAVPGVKLSWARPRGVRSIVVRACGAGGGAGGSGGARNEVQDNGGGGGGGAGSPVVTIKIDNLNAAHYFFQVGAPGKGGGGGRGGGNSGDGDGGTPGGDTIFGPSVELIPNTNTPVDPRVFRFPGGAGGSGGIGARGGGVDGRGGVGGSGPNAGGKGGDPDSDGAAGQGYLDTGVQPPITIAGGSGGLSDHTPATDGGGGGGGGAGKVAGGSGGLGGKINARGGAPGGIGAGGGGGGANGEANLPGTAGGDGGKGMIQIFRIP